MTAALARLLANADELLRARGRFAVDARSVPVAALAGLVLIFGATFGAAMGSFGGRALQMLGSAIKVPLLVGGATLLCLPGFYALNAVLGLRDDFPAACRAILAGQATLAVALCACAPLELLAYAASADYAGAVRASGICFLLATLAAQLTVAHHYRTLQRRHRGHGIARRLWALLYVLVAIQLAWVLRPFVGAPMLEPRFLRPDAWSNAYVVVVRDVLGIGSE